MALTLDLATFIAAFPGNDRLSKVTAPQLARYVRRAGRWVDENVWSAEDVEEGLLLVCAHLAELEARALKAPGSTGATRSRTVGAGVSGTRAKTNTRSGAGFWDSTLYGQQFAELRDTYVEHFLPQIY